MEANNSKDKNTELQYDTIKITSNKHHLGVTHPSTWKVYHLLSNPGLIFIQNPFTNHGQRYWIAKCLRDYPKAPQVNNLKNIKTLSSEDVIANWWQCLQNIPKNDRKQREKLKSSMRWVTLGYHHDWDSKVYTEQMKHKFPDDLNSLSQYFAKVLKLDDYYSAEAAIVNFYPFGTTLAGHTDHSEQNLDAPLFSYSFGQTAIFLIGGQTKDVKPTAIFLKSGDIAVMSRESRLCYHAVPKIMPAIHQPWKTLCDSGYGDDDDSADKEIYSKKRKMIPKDDCSKMDLELWENVSNCKFWEQFDDYVEDCRININVRQVLKSGQRTLL